MRSAFFPGDDPEPARRRPSPSRIPKPVSKPKRTTAVAPATVARKTLSRPIKNYSDLIELLPEEPRKGTLAAAFAAWDAGEDEDVPSSSPPPVPIPRAACEEAAPPARERLRQSASGAAVHRAEPAPHLKPEPAPLQRSQSPDLSRVTPAEARQPAAPQRSQRSAESIAAAAAALADTYPAPVRRSHTVPDSFPSYPPSLASSLSLPPFASAKRAPSGPASVAGAAHPHPHPYPQAAVPVPAGMAWPWMQWCAPPMAKAGRGYVLVNPFQFVPPGAHPAYAYAAQHVLPPGAFPVHPAGQRTAAWPHQPPSQPQVQPQAQARGAARRREEHGRRSCAAVNTSTEGEALPQRRDACVGTSFTFPAGAFAAALKQSVDAACQPTPRGAAPAEPPQPAPAREELPRDEAPGAEDGGRLGGYEAERRPEAELADVDEEDGDEEGEEERRRALAAAREESIRALRAALAAGAGVPQEPAAPASAPFSPSRSAPASRSSAAFPASREPASPAPAPRPPPSEDPPSPTIDESVAAAALARPPALRSCPRRAPAAAEARAAAWGPPSKGRGAALEVPRIRYVPLSDDDDDSGAGSGGEEGPAAALAAPQWAMRRHRGEAGRGWQPASRLCSDPRFAADDEDEDGLLSVRLTVPTR
eukprot:tig00001024_g6343.t1